MADPTLYSHATSLSRLTLITTDSAEPPAVLKDPIGLQALAKLYDTLLKLITARRWKKYWTNRDKALTEKVRDVVPDDVYGFVLKGRTSAVRVILPFATGRKVIDPQGFMDHIGDQWPELVKGVVVPPIVLENPAKYAAFVAAVREQLGEDVVAQLSIQVEWGTLDEKLEAGDLPPLPDGVVAKETLYRTIRPSKL